MKIRLTKFRHGQNHRDILWVWGKREWVLTIDNVESAIAVSKKGRKKTPPLILRTNMNEK